MLTLRSRHIGSTWPNTVAETRNVIIRMYTVSPIFFTSYSRNDFLKEDNRHFARGVTSPRVSPQPQFCSEADDRLLFHSSNSVLAMIYHSSAILIHAYLASLPTKTSPTLSRVHPCLCSIVFLYPFLLFFKSFLSIGLLVCSITVK